MKTIKTYFASANSYDGFKSNFSTVFNPSDFEKIYVIKGGPGTGKSTLMRTVARKFENESNVDFTEILCSSDPASLDGIILESSKAKVAILDGTSPHVYEPIYPGACEELIDLGIGFNQKELRGCKKNIVELSKHKKDAYKSAYNYLALAGKMRSEIEVIFNSIDIYSKAEERFDGLLECVMTESATTWRGDYYYTTAFNKNGFSYAPIAEKTRNTISVSGDGLTQYVLMKMLRERLLELGAVEQICNSPLTDTAPDTLFTEGKIFTVDNTSNTVIDTCVLINALPDEYTVLKKMHDDLLELSKRSFKLAAEKHSCLEKIYSQNTDFRKNKQIVERIFLETKDMLL